MRQRIISAVLVIVILICCLPVFASADNALFDETYWYWSVDTETALNHYLIFHSDGTYSSYLIHTETFHEGTYYYKNGILTIDGEIFP